MPRKGTWRDASDFYVILERNCEACGGTGRARGWFWKRFSGSCENCRGLGHIQVPVSLTALIPELKGTRWGHPEETEKED